MKTTKVNIEMAISRNYDKITLGMVDEPVQHEDDASFSIEVQKIFKRLRDDIELGFKKAQGG